MRSSIAFPASSTRPKRRAAACAARRGRRHVVRLSDLDRELLARARAGLDESALAALARDAEGELAPFRTGMAPAIFARAREAAIDRLVRERFKLPIVTFD